jgi:hypothetical protein
MALPGKAYANNETINNQADSHTYAVENIATKSGYNGKTGLKMDADTECFFGILNADNMVNFFLSLILTLLTRSLKE